MNRVKRAIFLFCLFIGSCTPAPAATSLPANTPVPTATPRPTITPTFTALPPTFISTPVPTTTYGYPYVMQVALFGPMFDERWPEKNYSIHQIEYNRESMTYGFVGEPVRILEKDEFPFVRGLGWSPGGKYVLYATSDQDVLYECMEGLPCSSIDLWIVSHDGTYKKRLTEETKFAHDAISWHPDESKFITFCQPEDSNEIHREICIVHLPEGEVEHTGYFAAQAAYSPTGESYIYSVLSEYSPTQTQDYYLVPE
jgi:hypothetical protein